MRFTICFLSLLLFTAQSLSCDTEPYQQFDFWVGEWEVTTPDGTLAGQNSVTKAESGCLIIEQWTGAQGGTGQSYNFYNPDTKTWRQLWVNRGAIIDYTGGLVDGAMLLEGEVINQTTGKSLPFRGTWTPLPNGDVEQKLDQWDRESNAWVNGFTGIYRKKEP